MAMTKKHFEALARALYSVQQDSHIMGRPLSSTQAHMMVQYVAKMCKSENINFDFARFYDAAAYPGVIPDAPYDDDDQYDEDRSPAPSYRERFDCNR